MAPLMIGTLTVASLRNVRFLNPGPVSSDLDDANSTMRYHLVATTSLAISHHQHLLVVKSVTVSVSVRSILHIKYRPHFNLSLVVEGHVTAQSGTPKVNDPTKR